MTKYQLTPEGKKLGNTSIRLFSNRLGDPSVTITPSRLTDELAAQLLKRKDGRGMKYVQKRGTPKKESPKGPAKK